ncbi:MAG: PolC-type DNA polymerase III, partial [Fidelibacterota bacterium]
MLKSELLTSLGLRTFVVFDFETTGLSPETDRLIEIAALKFVDGKVADRFVTLVNPGFPISAMITDITGISNKMVSGSPKEDDLVDEFQEFLGDSPLVAHNISFDWSFLTALRRRFDQPEVANPLYDTLSLSRTFLFDLPAFNLGTVSEHYGLSAEGSHRAEKDTENCGAIFLELVEEAASYRLSVITRLLEILKPGSFANQELYSALARELVRKGLTKTGLVPPRRDHHMMNNTYFYEGDTDIS